MCAVATAPKMVPAKAAPPQRRPAGKSIYIAHVLNDVITVQMTSQMTIELLNALDDAEDYSGNLPPTLFSFRNRLDQLNEKAEERTR